MPVNSYLCLNIRCKHEFAAKLENPFCPNCGGARCRWIPKACTIGTGVVQRADKTMRQLVDEHNERVGTNGARIYDVKPERGQPTIKPAPAPETYQHAFNTPFGPLTAALPKDREGRPLPVCVPLPLGNGRQGEDMKLGGAVTPDGWDGPANLSPPRPLIEASHKGKA